MLAFHKITIEAETLASECLKQQCSESVASHWIHTLDDGSLPQRPEVSQHSTARHKVVVIVLPNFLLNALILWKSLDTFPSRVREITNACLVCFPPIIMEGSGRGAGQRKELQR
jgi:hypothetical protein